MKCVFQVVRRSDGVRSPAAEADRVEFARVLRQMLDERPENLAEDDFVLVLMEYMGEPGARVSVAPMMTVARFVQEFHVQEPCHAP